MPWKHCQIAFILDDEKCPTCGVDKAAWTINVEQTRVMQLTRKRAAVEVELIDLTDAPVPEAAYEATLASGAVRKGTLNDKGLAFVKNLVPGVITVDFPDHHTGGSFEITAEFIKAKQRVRKTYVAGHWIEIKLLDRKGEPVPNEPYKVVFPEDDGIETREGTLNEAGFAQVGGLPKAGPCTVSFPRRYHPPGSQANVQEATA